MLVDSGADARPMQPSEGFVLDPSPSPNRKSAQDWVIEPWIAAPAQIVVYEYGARLDVRSQALAREQIAKARALYNTLVAFIRTVHAEMNAWVLAQAGAEAQAMSERLRACGAELARARADGNGEALRQLAQRRLDVDKALLALLRPVRARHRETLRRDFFARIGRTTATQTYRLRCEAVEAGLGWATANAVLESALVAWNRAIAIGHAPRTEDPDLRDQDSLCLQFPTKGGLPVHRLVDGSSHEIHLQLPGEARRRAYAAFRFRLGLARVGADAVGTWQCHRALPENAHVAVARLVRRRVADRDRWSLHLVLRLAEPLRPDRQVETELAAVHFGWTRTEGGRRVATIARSADPAGAREIVLPESVEADLERAAEWNARRAGSRVEAVRRLLSLEWPATGLPADVAREIAALRREPAEKVAARRLYRLRDELAECGRHQGWLDAWVAEDRKRWQGALLTARRARGRRRDFYRRVALELATRHSAVALEPLNLKAASRATNFGGEWTEFSRHARAGRAVVALNEFEQAIRWACARHGTPVFEVAGPTTRSCASCGADEMVTQLGGGSRLLCLRCGSDVEKGNNAAATAWQRVHHGLKAGLQAHDRLADDRRRDRAEAQTRKLDAVRATRRETVGRSEK